MDGIATQCGMVGGAAAAGGPLSFVYRDSGVDTSNASSYSVTGLGIGAAADRQYVIACIFTRALGSNLSFSSITVGGVSATTIASYSGNDNGGGGATTALYIVAAAVPTGTTADVNWNTSLSSLRGAAAVYTVNNLNSLVAQDTDTDTDPSNVTLTTVTCSPVCSSAPALAISVGQCNDGSSGFDDFQNDLILAVEGYVDFVVGAEILEVTGTKSTNFTPHEVSSAHLISTVIS